jgi:putative hydrolase of the HAD superfamily/5'-nucleotidase
MARDYELPACFDDFPSLAEGLRRYGRVSEADLPQLEAVFSAHELGSVSSSYGDLLRRLSCTHQLGIVCNIWARKAPWQAELARAGVANLFRVAVYSSDSRSIKPSPALFREALRAFPAGAQVIFVGDSFRCDIAPAKALGLATAWISMSGSSPLADYVLPDLHAIEVA